MTEIDTAALRALMEKATKGPFECGHLADDAHSCECTSIFDNFRMGAIGQVFYGKDDDRFKDEYPSKEEAKANLRLIVSALNALPALLDAYDDREQMKSSVPSVIVHIPADLNNPQAYHAFGNVRLFIVDEGAPNDRVYEITDRAPPERFAELIHDGEAVGSKHDERHEAISNRVLAALDGRLRFEVIDGDA